MPDVIAIPGRHDWLFLDGDTNSLIKQLTGDLRISAQDLASWEAELFKRSNFLRELNIPFLFLIAPNKESVYPEFLPDGIARAETCPVDELIGALQRVDFPYLFPMVEMQQARRILEPYSPIDTHWNDYGSLVAANIILGHFGRRAIGLGECQFHIETWQGDLGSKCVPVQTGPFLKGELRSGNKARVAYDNQMVHGGHITIHINETSTEAGTLFVFGDSFSERVIHWLAERFYKVCFLHATAFDISLITEERPNYILWECAERFVIAPPAPMSSGFFENLLLRKLSTLPLVELEELKTRIESSRISQSRAEAPYLARQMSVIELLIDQRVGAGM